MTASAYRGPLARHIGNAPRLIEAIASHGKAGTATFDAARRSTPPRKRNATASRQGRLWRLLRVRITLLRSEGWSHRHHAAQGTVPQPVACEVRSSPRCFGANSISGVYIFKLVASVMSEMCSSISRLYSRRSSHFEPESWSRQGVG